MAFAIILLPMWDKYLRVSLVSSIYSILYWGKYFDNYIEFEISEIIESLDLDLSEEKIHLIENQVSLFIKSKLDLTETLKAKLQDWDKTSMMAKSVLYTFLLEKKNMQSLNINQIITDLEIKDEDALNKRIANNYIKICEQYIDKQISSVVHAVILKLD